eukprot:CAMPEP_0177271250 /NCGR_PEP_ID=MMETSP0367-20130122/65417_1 /TAXON_ID=447022 ORGANISM="Scrippsiella hangoei-like, Strain SHHI-4" /NCGR_SAMPLE_ID=MMETSP0367 /ASSEMBLY_ACC=CAM_ASM_000362 /LENGTH=30 /DNA_ID= /DNA_START= /DNA_END= /DNA_ORIENTATION=
MAPCKPAWCNMASKQASLHKLRGMPSNTTE